MTVKSKEEAWNIANMIFPTDYAKDEELSHNAGYGIYVSTAKEYNDCHISDLGNRLELNIHSASINIFVDDPAVTRNKLINIIKEAMKENLLSDKELFNDVAYAYLAGRCRTVSVRECFEAIMEVRQQWVDELNKKTELYKDLLRNNIA